MICWLVGNSRQTRASALVQARFFACAAGFAAGAVAAGAVAAGAVAAGAAGVGEAAAGVTAAGAALGACARAPTGYPPAMITPHAIAATNRFMIGRPLSIDAAGQVRLAQKETTNLAVLDYQRDQSVISAVFEFELPQVDLVPPLIQPGQEAGGVALIQTRRKLRAETVEHRLRHGGLEGRVATGNEIRQRL